MRDGRNGIGRSNGAAVRGLCFLAGLALAVSGCSEGSGVSTGSPGPDGPATGPTAPGLPDIESNGVVTIDEAQIQGAISNGQIALTVPVKAVSGATKGTIWVGLPSVDDLTYGTSSVEMPYDLNDGETATLETTLALPDGLASLQDLVGWNVRAGDADLAKLRVTRSLFTLVQPYEVRLEGPRTLRMATQAAYRVRAQDPITFAPLSGLPVTLVVQNDEGEVYEQEQTTAETGDAVFELELETAGTYSISAAGSRDGTTSTIGEDITVEVNASKLLLTTDKPIYQPGQRMHLRALAMEKPALAPIAGRPVLFEVEDGKGNKIFKSTIDTDEFGIAATTFQLGSILNMGSFAVSATMDEHKSQRVVEVSQYALPKFKVALTTDRTWYLAGAPVDGVLHADYFFGQPTAGANVKIEAITYDVGETVFQEVLGATDEDGQFAFQVQLPTSLVGLPLEQGKALVNLRTTVTDPAGQEVAVEKALVVAQDPVELTLVPEGTTLVPNLDNRMHLFATDPLGAPVGGAAVTVTETSTGARPVAAATTDVFGHALFAWSGDSDEYPTFRVELVTEERTEVEKTFSFSNQPGATNVLVRTDKSVYSVGETIDISVLSSDPDTHVYIDWLNDGQIVDMRTLEASEGEAKFSVDVDNGLLGSNRIEAYVVDANGSVIRAGRTVFVRNETSLTVELKTDKAQYAPGESAKLTFEVRDESGQATVAALGVQIVDEAVFALVDAKPGLLKTYFELEDEFAEPSYQIKGPVASLNSLLFTETASEDPVQAEAAQVKTEATLAALGSTSVTGVQKGSWAEVKSQASTILLAAAESERARLLPMVSSLAASAISELEGMGCSLSEPWNWCDALDRDVVDALGYLISERAEEWDPWGTAYTVVDASYSYKPLRLRSAGPDETDGTWDDWALDYEYEELDLAEVLEQLQVPTPQAGGGWGEGGDGGGDWDEDFALEAEPSEPGAPTNKSNEDGDEPRVRNEFPETLYVNPALITGPDGTATVELDMADSITEWRVSSLAHSKSGRLGSGLSGVTVFQDFFVDIDFPATLTRGDELGFPVALYNYLDSPQTVELVLESGDWYSALGETTTTVELAPNEVRGVRFPVRVETVGLHTLTVFAYGSEASDAVARTVRVVPDGKELPNAQSGALEAGTLSLSVDFPGNAVEGSEVLFLNVYPAYLSQVVEGMDSLLQTPTGCFEQTTATTWPNVLVTDYMDATGQVTPEIQLKAESLISAGYQRLLTYEHAGGGYSWFGEPGDPYLSVTALGLMEFVDMSKVYPVDETMIQRTRDWLVAQQKGDGSWEGDISEFFTFHTSTVRNTAFVLWSLATAGTTGAPIDNGIAYVKANLSAEPADPYSLAIVANALAIAAPNDPLLTELLADLNEAKKVEGEFCQWDSGGSQTTFYEAGNSSAVSATALVAHAMLVTNTYPQSVDCAVQFLLSNKDSLGNWGTTQATIWTLRTLLATATQGTEGAVGTLNVTVDGTDVATVELSEDKWDLMTTVDLSNFTETGNHDVELTFAGEGKVSYNLVDRHHIPWAEVPATGTGVLSVAVAYDKTELQLNDVVEATVTLTNNTAQLQNMVMVTLGIPPGFEVDPAGLVPDIESGKLSKIETTAAQLTLYLTELPGEATETFRYNLVATMPVKASDGGAAAYLYYEPEERTAAPSQELTTAEM